MATENITVNAKLNADTGKAKTKVDLAAKSLEDYRQAAIRANKATKAAAQFSNNAARNFAKQSAEYSKVIQLYASTAATLFTVTSAFRALKEAADTQVMESSMKSLTAITGYSVAVMVKDLKELSNGAISSADAMRAANLSATAGIDPETFKRIGLAAKGAAKALGRDYGDALDRITKGIIKAEPELLDELGIIVRLDTVYQDYAKSLGTTAIKLTEFEKSQARTNAVLGQAESKYGDLSAEQANDIQKIAATASDMVKEISSLGVSLVSTFTPILSSVPGMIGAFALIGTIIAKNWIPNISEFEEKTANIAKRNSITRKYYVDQSNLLTEKEKKSKKLNLVDKIHLTMQRAELDTKRKLLILEREHIEAKTERNVASIMTATELGIFDKVKGVFLEIKSGVAKLNADYKAANVGLENMNKSTKSVLATQHLYNKALLVGKVTIQAFAAVFSKLLGIIGVVTIVYSYLAEAYDKFFVTDADRAKEESLERIKTLVDDQTKLLKQQQIEAKKVGNTYADIAQNLIKSIRAVDDLGKAVLNLSDFSTANAVNAPKMLDGFLGVFGYTTDKVEELEVRKKSLDSLLDFADTIDSRLRAKIAKLFDASSVTFLKGGETEFKNILTFLSRYSYSMDALTASAGKAVKEFKDFANVQPKKTIFSSGITAADNYLDSVKKVNKETEGLSPESAEYQILTDSMRLNAEETVKYLKKVGLYNGTVFYGLKDNIGIIAALRKELADAQKESLAFDTNFANAKRGTGDQINTRATLKTSADIISDAQSNTSRSGANPALLAAEYDIKIKIQELNKAQLASAKSGAIEYRNSLNVLIASTTAEAKRAQYMKEREAAQDKISQIEREQADALDTEISKQEQLLKIEEARTNQAKATINAMGAAMGSTGSVWASAHAQLFGVLSSVEDLNLAQLSYSTTVTDNKARLGELNTILALSTDENEKNGASVEKSAILAAQDAYAQEKRAATVALVSSAMSAAGQMIAASYAMQADAIGYQIQMEQKRDGKSAESQEKIKKLQEKQIKEDAKAKKIQIVMATAAAAMQSIATLGVPWGLPFAALSIAMGAQQLAAVDQATSGQLGVLNTNAGGGNDSNKYSVSNVGKVDLTSSAAAGEIEQYRATGGSVSSGTSVTLGEKGPETVMFNEDVMVKPASDGNNSSTDRVVQPLQINITAVDSVDVQRLFANNGASLLNSLEQEANSRGISITGGRG